MALSHDYLPLEFMSIPNSKLLNNFGCLGNPKVTSINQFFTIKFQIK